MLLYGRLNLRVTRKGLIMNSGDRKMKIGNPLAE